MLLPPSVACDQRHKIGNSSSKSKSVHFRSELSDRWSGLCCGVAVLQFPAHAITTVLFSLVACRSVARLHSHCGACPRHCRTQCYLPITIPRHPALQHNQPNDPSGCSRPDQILEDSHCDWRVTAAPETERPLDRASKYNPIEAQFCTPVPQFCTAIIATNSATCTDIIET